MSLRQFLIYVCYSQDCPAEVNPKRWQGMICWMNSRSKFNESIGPLEF